MDWIHYAMGGFATDVGDSPDKDSKTCKNEGPANIADFPDFTKMTFEKDTNAPKIQQPDDIADFPDFTKMMFDKVPRAPEIVVTVPTAALISTQNIRETSPAKELQPPVNPQYIKDESPPKSPEMYVRDLSPAMQENSLAVVTWLID